MSDTATEKTPETQISQTLEVEQLPNEETEIANIQDDDADRASVVSHAKKKKKKKPKSKRGLNKPTGFEEFHADGPLPPDEVAEDENLYHKDLSFVDRILTAIQRFEQTRKLNSERRDVFFKYLAYGGIDVGPNMFQGGIDEESLDRDQLIAAQARTSIAADKKDLDSVTSLYAVDFVGCMKAFLSHRAPVCFPFETRDQVELLTTTLERFMDYLLQHDACPEYKSEILSTRNLCRKATEEIWNGAQLAHWLPGDFNAACSTLTGGRYAEMFDGQTSWAPAESVEEPVYVGMSSEQAQEVIKFAIAGAAPEEIFKQYWIRMKDGGDDKLVIDATLHAVGFEVTKIIPPSRQCLELYNIKAPHLRPVGVVYAKEWRNPCSPPQDWSPTEKISREPDGEGQIDKVDAYVSSHEANPQCRKDQAFVFLMDGSILNMLRVGTKIDAMAVHKLDFGVWFFDGFTGIYPSFEHWICNELMVGWKEPRMINGEDYNGQNGGNSNEEDDDERGDVPEDAERHAPRDFTTHQNETVTEGKEIGNQPTTVMNEARREEDGGSGGDNEDMRRNQARPDQENENTNSIGESITECGDRQDSQSQNPESDGKVLS